MNAFTAFWNTLEPIHTQLAAFAFTVTAGYIAYRLQPRVRLVWGMSNNSFHHIKREGVDISVYGEKHFVQNTGRKPAERVEIILGSIPDDVSIYPPRTFDKAEVDGRLVIGIPYIAPRELVILDTIHINKPTAEVVSVHCAEHSGKRVAFWTVRRFPNSVYWLLMGIIILGAVYAVQILAWVAYGLLKIGSLGLGP